MSQQDLLSKVVQALDGSGCAYMLTGSFASSMQGEPRLSHDIDLVVDLTPQALPELLKKFPSPEFYLDEQSIREAISARTMFIHAVSMIAGENAVEVGRESTYLAASR